MLEKYTQVVVHLALNWCGCHLFPSEGTVLSGTDSCEDQPRSEASLSYEPSVLEVDVQGKAVGVWVSCAEIYNEFIYDLFAEIPTTTRVTRQKGKSSHPQRHALRLAEDKNHNVFIKGKLLITPVSSSTGTSTYICMKFSSLWSTYVRMCLCVHIACVLSPYSLSLKTCPTSLSFWVFPCRGYYIRDFPCRSLH